MLDSLHCTFDRCLTIASTPRYDVLAQKRYTFVAPFYISSLLARFNAHAVTARNASPITLVLRLKHLSEHSTSLVRLRRGRWRRWDRHLSSIFTQTVVFPVPRCWRPVFSAVSSGAMPDLWGSCLGRGSTLAHSCQSRSARRHHMYIRLDDCAAHLLMPPSLPIDSQSPQGVHPPPPLS